VTSLLERIAALNPDERSRLMKQLRTDVPGGPDEVSPGSLPDAQQRLWLLQQMNPGTAAYHLSAGLRLDGPLDRRALERTLTEIAARHEPLRTSFTATNGVAVHRLHPPEPVRLSTLDISDVAEPDRYALAQSLTAEYGRRPFDLERAPLARYLLFRLDHDQHVLGMVAHHLVIDGWSFGVLAEEIAVLYAAYAAGRPSPLPRTAGSYRAAATRHRPRPRGLDYWLEHLSGDLPVLDLPADHPRPAEPTFIGRRYGFTCPPVLADDVKAAAAQSGTTVYSVLLAAYAVTLHRIGGQEEFVVGVPVSGRPDPESERLIGLFVNTLPLRIDLRGCKRLADARRSADATLRAGLTAEMPYGDIVRAVNPPRLPGRALLRQTALSFQPAAARVRRAGDLAFTPAGPADFDLGVSPLDLTLHIREQDGTLSGCIEFSTDLFDPATAGRWAELFLDTLAEAVRDPDQPIRPDHAAQTVTNLTEGQTLLLFGAEFTPDVRLYYEYVTALYSIPADVDPETFGRAVQSLVDRSDSLRSTIHRVRGVPTSRVRAPFPVRLDVVDLSGEADPDEAARQWAGQRSAAPLDLTVQVFDTALLRLGPSRHAWYLNVHHAFCDAWSMSLILRAVSGAYELDRAGRLEQAPPLPDFQAYVAEEAKIRASPLYHEAQRHWSARLAEPVARLDFYRDPTTAPGTRITRSTVDLGTERSGRVAEFTRAEGLTSPAVVLAAALFAYLYRMGGGSTLRVGTPFANRPTGFRETIGMFMSVRPLQAGVTGRTPLRQVARDVQRAFLEASRYQHYPLRNAADAPLYDAYFNYQNARFSGFGASVGFDLIGTGHSVDRLALQVRDRGGAFVLDFDFNLACFDGDQRTRTVEHYLRLLDALLDEPEAELATAPMLSTAEESVIDGFNATERAYPADVVLHEWVRRQSERTPDAPAVIFEDRMLTYSELDAAANRVARRLVSTMDIAPGDVVAVHLDRSLGMVVALLGVLKAGGAYLPIDPGTPAERLAFMLSDAQVRAVLTDRPLDASDVPVLTVAEAAASGVDSAPVQTRVGADDPAYLIYTSGSTGTPKCAVLPHRGIVNRLLWMQDEYRLAPEERVLQKTPFTFDVSVWEFFWPLMTGATMVVASPGGHRDPHYLTDLIERERITTVHFVPSMLRVFLAAQEPGRFTPLRRIIASGEALPGDLVRRHFAIYPAGVDLHNLYGPTEASVDVSHWACRPQDADGNVPIGRPVANTTLEVLDADLTRLPLGAVGELHIGGVQLALGYRNRPELTAERFVPHPRPPGGRLYKTGDLVRQRNDGALEFLGRRDGQVKLRGYRVELGEIEAALMRHGSVRAAAVRVWEDRLVAAIVPVAEPPDAAELTAHLSRSLPGWMVPDTYQTLAALPITANGKLDRAALPPPAGTGVREPGSPRTPIEETVIRMWAGVLGCDPADLDVHDNFFARGGHSLLAARLIADVGRDLAVRLPLAALFQAPTVAQFAALLSGQSQKPPATPVIGLRPATAEPIFLIHPAGGDLMAYARLVAALPSGREILGIQSRALSGEPEYDSVAAMAEAYAHAIRDRQPAGPYLLAGWSMGGALAVEVASVIEAAGEQVALLALIDSSVPGAAAEDPLLAPAVALAASVSSFELTAADAAALRQRLGGRPLDERLRLLAAWIDERGLRAGDREPDEVFRRQAELAAHHERLLVGHRAPVVTAPLTLVWAADVLHDRRTGWAAHTRAGIREETTLPGNHFTLLRPPNVDAVATRLAAAAAVATLPSTVEYSPAK